jgi:hypothetical protein
MNYIEWAKREIEYAKLVEHKDTTEITNDDDRRCEEIMNDYVDSVYDSALALLVKFSEQDHSGMSAGITLRIFNKLAKWEPLTPLTGDENEWSNETTGDQAGWEEQQNIRDTRVFRELNSDKTEWEYRFNDILEIENSDEIWEKYPPFDDPGSLDDENPSVKNYYKQRRNLKKKLESEIKFPYTPIIHHYIWDFITETFYEKER